MEQIKKYFKSKTGMITTGILVALIILCIVLLVSCLDNDKAGKNDKGNKPGNTVENMDDADMTVSDDTEGPKIEDGSTDFSDTEEEGDLDETVSNIQNDDVVEDDGADIEDPTPGVQWGPLY